MKTDKKLILLGSYLNESTLKKYVNVAVFLRLENSMRFLSRILPVRLY